MTEPMPPAREAAGIPAIRAVAQEPEGPDIDPVARFDIQGSLREHAARGALINTAFLVFLSSLGLIKNFVLAGFLSRTDYGIWGLLAVSLGTLVGLKQVGIGDKYVQQDEADQEVAFQKAFTLELLFSGSLVLVLAAALPLFALIYGVPEIIPPGLVLLLVVLAGALQAPLWIFYRRMQFGRQRLLESIDPVVGLIVSVVLAALGAGYWALVLGLVAGSLASAIAALLCSPFRPRLRYERGTLRTYVQFSVPLFISMGAGIVIAQSGVIVAQAHLGLAAIGVIALASTITSFTDRIDQLVTGTLYPAICAVKDKTALLQEAFVKSNRLALMWAVPFGTALTLFCSDLVTYGIGEKWRPAVIVLQIYGVLAAANHLGFNWDAFFRARGETRPIAVTNVAAMVAFLAVGIPLLLVYDLRGFALGVAFQGLVHLGFRAAYLQRLFQGFGFLGHAMRAALPTLPAVGVVLLVRVLEPTERTLGIALGELSLYIAVTVVATWWFERSLLRETVGYFLRRSPGPPTEARA